MSLIESLKKHDFFAFWICGEEGFFHLVGIVLDDRIGGIDDHLGRAVVFFEVDDLGFWVVFSEREDIFYIGSSP